MYGGLKRLSGAKDVEMGAPVTKGAGSWVVNFTEQPKVKMADIKKELAKYKIDKVTAKITATVTEKDKAYSAGDLALANGKDAGDVLADLAKLLAEKKVKLVLSGLLSEDDKGKQTLALTKVAEPDKK